MAYPQSTISHAILCINNYRTLADKHAGEIISCHRLFLQANPVKVPCKAIGLAKKALNVEGWNIDKAIARLTAGATGL